MADEIFKIKIEGFEDAAQRIAELDVQLGKLRETRNELLNVAKKEGDLGEMQKKQLAEVTTQIERLTAQKKDANAILKAGVALTDQQRGAYAKLNAQLNEARQRYKDLAAAGKENTTEGKALLAQIQALDGRLKAIDESVGQHQRSVGHYSKALSGLTGVFPGLNRGIQGFNTALKANPILLVVSLVAGLIQWLSKLQVVVDTVNYAMNALNAAFGVIIERVKLLLSGDLIGAFRGLASAITDATQAGYSYGQILKKLRDDEQVLNIAMSERNKEIAILLAQLRDKSKTYTELIRIAERANELERENYKETKRIAEERARIEKENIVRLLKQRGIMVDNAITYQQLIRLAQQHALQDKEIKKLEDAVIRLNDVERESLALQERIEARMNTIAQRREEALQRARELQQREIEEMERAADRAKQNMEKIINSLVDSMADSEEKLTKKIYQIIDEEKRVLDLQLKKEEERFKNWVQERAKAAEFLTQFQKSTVTEQYNYELAVLKNMLQNGYILQSEYNEAVKQLRLEQAEMTMALSANTLNSIAQLLGKESKAHQALAVTATIINTAQAVMKALATYGWTPQGFLAIASTTATGAAQLNKILNTRPKFAKGGIIGGEPHERGGTVFVGSDGSVFEAERGELLAIVNKRDTALLESLSRLNSIHGKKFATGGIVEPIVSDNQLILRELISTLKTQRVYVLERDITEAQRRVRIIERTGLL